MSNQTELAANNADLENLLQQALALPTTNEVLDQAKTYSDENFLPLTGGTLNGNIIIQKEESHLASASSASVLGLRCGSDNYNQEGPSIWLHGKDFAEEAGTLRLQTYSDDFGYSILDMKNNGSLLFGDSPLAAIQTLWTNPNPNADFLAQTVTLSRSLTNFDYIMVIATTDPPNTSKQYTSSSWVPIEIGNMGTITGIDINAWSHIRKFTIKSNTTIEFTKAVMIQHVAGGHNIYDNEAQYQARAIPQRIIGIRAR